MRHVTAVLEREDDTQVAGAAAALAELFGVSAVPMPIVDRRAVDRAATVEAALTSDDVVGAALSAHGASPVCWDVMTRVDQPLLVVPRRSNRVLRHVRRVLLPLDGTAETSYAVAGIARRALDTGAQVTAVHVFDTATVPAFWDQAAHTHGSWTREFLRRHLPAPVELDLRSGRPAEEVLAEADESGADLVVVAWGRDLDHGRASTVRRAIDEGLTPVLLVATPLGPLPHEVGPSALQGGDRPG